MGMQWKKGRRVLEIDGWHAIVLLMIVIIASVSIGAFVF